MTTEQLRVMAAATILSGAESIEGGWPGEWSNLATGEVRRSQHNPGLLYRVVTKPEDADENWKLTRAPAECAAAYAVELADAIIRHARSIPPP